MPGTANERPRPLTTEDIAADFGVSLATARAMCERGDIPAVKLAGRWYVTRENLDKLLAGELP